MATSAVGGGPGTEVTRSASAASTSQCPASSGAYVASVSGSGTTYTVTVNSLSGDGTLRLDLNSSGTGIQNGSSVAIASGYTSGSTYTLDHTAPNAPSTPDIAMTFPSSSTGSQPKSRSARRMSRMPPGSS